MSGNGSRVLKSPHKIGITPRSRSSRQSPRKHIMPAIPLEKDFVKKKVVTSEQPIKTSDVKAEVGKIEDEDEEGNLTTISEMFEKLEDDFNDNFIITPPSPSSDSDMLDDTVIVVRDSQDIGSEGETSNLRIELSEQSRKFEVEVQKKKDCEVHLRDKLLEEKKKQERVEKQLETRRMFIKQDLQVLRQKLKRKENASWRKESPTIVEESESEEDAHENTNVDTSEDTSEKASENGLEI